MTQREMNLRPLSAVKHEIVYWFINLSTPCIKISTKQPKTFCVISWGNYVFPWENNDYQ